MSRKAGRSGRPALDLIEDAVHLLRTVPVSTLAIYYLGALPFVLAFLFFWSDMSRSAFARERLEPLAALLTILFVLMKVCQFVFVRRLREKISGVALPRIPGWSWIPVVSALTFWTASAFVILPVSTFFIWWTYSFYQCLTAHAAASGRFDGETVRKTWRLSWLWRGQSLALFLMFLAAGFVVCLNIGITLVVLPHLLKQLLGIESQFTQSFLLFTNTTFQMSVVAIAWLCLDPLVKAVYLLRAFHAESLTTGDDILAELRAIRRPRLSGTIALIGLLLTGVMASGAESTSASSISETVSSPTVALKPAPQSASPGELDQAIDEVLKRREYTWRMPREELEKVPVADNWLKRALRRIFDWLFDVAKSVGRTVLEIIRWVLDKVFGQVRAPQSAGKGWTDATRGLFILLLIALAGAIGYLIYRLWKNYQTLAPEVLAQPVAAPLNLDDDNLTAAQLPEDEWLRLAREMMARGDFRLALRALYLGGLAHLAGRGLLTIARYKSNHEYALELGRRAHALPEVMNAFTSNVAVFDRIWYGQHAATNEVVADFESNLHRIIAA